MTDQPSPRPHVTGFDHIVLRVADVERSLAFYCDELGLTPERVEEWRRGEAPFASVRADATTVIDLVAVPEREAGSVPEREAGVTSSNMDHFCLVVEPVDLDALKAGGRFTVVDGPGPRWGAQGWATSLYVLDPDGNTVELRHY